MGTTFFLRNSAVLAPAASGGFAAGTALSCASLSGDGGLAAAGSGSPPDIGSAVGAGVAVGGKGGTLSQTTVAVVVAAVTAAAAGEAGAAAAAAAAKEIRLAFLAVDTDASS
uniref:Putative secreted protein n=1 Tax=Anopheles marajoara TaxID=58244 RepID=A0A2M4C7Q1_9DIPT